MGGGGATEITRALPMMNAQYVKAKTCVWWDIENCGVPRSCDPYSIAQNISKSLADMNYKGVVTISAYGDTTQINSFVQQALSSTGIALNHVPAGIKDASDKKILVDMLIWGYDNPPPANHLLISGDRDFSNALHQLSLRKYNILLAQPEKASQALVSAAKTVWLWTSLAVGGRPFDKLPNFHNTSTNNKSNIVTASNRIMHSSQPDDFNLKNNNNGNFYNGNIAKQISKTQSHLVVSSSSSNGIEDGNKRSIESSDSSKSKHENDLKHPNHPFVSTIADLASNCTTSIANPTTFIPKSKKLVDSGKFNAQCRPTSNYAPEIEQKYGNKIPSNTATTDGSGVQESSTKDTTKINNESALSCPSPFVVPESSKPLSIGPTFANIQPIPDMVRSNHENELTQPSHAHEAKGGNIANSTTDWYEVQESTINDTMKINNKSTLSRPSPLVVPESSKPLSISPTFANIQPLPDMASSNHENELTQPSDAHEAKGENISNTSSSFSMKSSSQALPESNCITCNTNPTPCIPKPQQLVDSVKSNAPCEPISSYIPKFMQKFVQRIPSNIAKSTTDGSEVQESTIDDTMKINNKSTSSRPSPLVVPESSKPLSIGPTFATIEPLPDMASSNHENELTQPSDAHEAKGGNISNISSSFSMKPSSQALPESNCITCNTNPTPCNPKPQQLVDSVKFNAPSEPISSYIPKFMQKFVQRIPSNITKSTTDGSEMQESTINDTTKINNNSTSSRPSSLVVPEPSKPLSISPTFANIQPLLDMASSNHENELTQPSDAHEAKGGNISNTSSSFSTKSSSQALPESNCITCNTNPTPCISKPQQLVDSVKFNAPCEPISRYKPKFMQKFVQRIPSNIAKSTTDGSEVQESTIDDTTKISNYSTSSRPSPLVVPKSSKSLSIGSTFANIQPLPDMASSNHENELTQPSHAHEAKDGGHINSTSSSFSMKSFSQVLPESNSPNEPKINANNKVKPFIKGNRNCFYKQQQNKYSRSYFHSRNFFGANYNHSSSSSSAPTIRPNNYQSVPSTVPNVSPTPIPDIGKLNVSNHPYPTQSTSGSSIFTGDTMSNNRSGGNLKWPASANCLGGQMGFILEALNILKSEMISPTKANISDCFRYGNIGVQNFNVQSALDYAIEHQVVVMHKSEGNCMDLYVGRNDTLWNCVNFMDSDANHDTENFDSVLNFLSSANGRSAIISSQCRYQAALILRQFCLKEIVLGEILQILDIVIRFRKWIIPHPDGWQPLAVTVFVNPNEVSTSSRSTAFGWG